MKISQILKSLYDKGHFRSPLYRGGASWDVTRKDLETISPGHPAVREAISSFEQFMTEPLEAISFKIHGRAAVYEGDIKDDATLALFAVERCACPDYPTAEAIEAGLILEATGSGSWPANCLPDWRDTHAITIAVDKSGMASFLKPVFEGEVWARVQKAYSEIGVMLVRQDENPRANLQTSFRNSVGGMGAIGLAIVPNGQTCQMSVWNRYRAGYQPRNVVNEWTTLIMHELGHNMGLNHSRGGVMNPSIVEGLPLSWLNDTSFSVLKRWFGGEPVSGAPDGPEMWIRQELISNRGNRVAFDLHPPLIRGA